MDVSYLHISITGAGMSGLATASALVKQGFRNVDVFELAAYLGFVDVSIELAPHVLRFRASVHGLSTSLVPIANTHMDTLNVWQCRGCRNWLA